MGSKLPKASAAAVKDVIETVLEQKATAETTNNALTQRIYIGPALLQLGAYTVIEKEPPTHIKTLIEKCPSIENLFVPVEKLTELEPKAKTKGTIEYRHFQAVLAYINKKERE